MRPVSVCKGKHCTFGDNAFEDAQSGGDLLVRLLNFELKKQCVFEFAHVDPWDGHSDPVKRMNANPAKYEKHVQHRAHGVEHRDGHDDRNDRSRSRSQRSRSTGITGHVASEYPV